MIQKSVGISFNPVKDENIKVGTKIQIVHDKGNKYSSRAITIKAGDVHLGHIGEKNNPLHEEVFKELPLEGEVHTLSVLEEGEEFGKFKTGEITHLEVEFPMPSDTADGIYSFNEPDELIYFNPEKHEYKHKDEKLVGGSTYIKRWLKDFDKNMVAGFVSKSVGCNQKEIIDIWNGTGKISADYGTVIHNALEHYENFKVIGKILQDKKDLPFNKALPTHPALREIVEEFLARFTHKDDNIMAEVLVSNVEKGLCGYIDRLKIIDQEKKICIVEDYKININSDTIDKNIKYLGQFADLPKTKLSKYQLQLSFYARLLELSGWEVQGIVAYVYEDKWVKHELEILKLDF